MKKLFLLLSMLFVTSTSYAFGSLGCDNKTVLLYHMDGANNGTAFGEENCDAGTAHPATANGNAKTSTSTVKLGTASGSFDGTNSYLNVATSTDFDLGSSGSGDFTLEFWMNLTVSNTLQAICNAGGNQTTGYAFAWIGSEGKFGILLNNGSYTRCSATSTVNPSTWYHVAFVRSGGTITVYLNGTSQGTFTDQAFNSNGQSFQIGQQSDSSGWVNGFIDEFRLSKGVARWTANFTPPSSPYCAGCEMMQVISES